MSFLIQMYQKPFTLTIILLWFLLILSISSSSQGLLLALCLRIAPDGPCKVPRIRPRSLICKALAMYLLFEFTILTVILHSKCIYIFTILIVLYCIALHCIVLHCIVLHYIVLYCVGDTKVGFSPFIFLFSVSLF